MTVAVTITVTVTVTVTMTVTVTVTVGEMHNWKEHKEQEIISHGTWHNCWGALNPSCFWHGNNKKTARVRTLGDPKLVFYSAFSIFPKRNLLKDRPCSSIFSSSNYNYSGALTAQSFVNGSAQCSASSIHLFHHERNRSTLKFNGTMPEPNTWHDFA